MCLMVYRFFLKPLYFSPFRNMPGPPLGHPVYGQFKKMITDEPGIRMICPFPYITCEFLSLGTLQMKWADDYGPVVRFIGPYGLDHLLFLEPSALEHILVRGRMNYPRVIKDLVVFLISTKLTHY